MYVSSGGMVGVLALAMFEVEHFWIANALYRMIEFNEGKKKASPLSPWLALKVA